MDLVQIYTKYKGKGFDFTPGVFVGNDLDESSPIIFIDKKFISGLPAELVNKAKSKVEFYLGKEGSELEAIVATKVQWESLERLLSDACTTVLDPDDYDVREHELIELPKKLLPLPDGFLVCRNLKGFIVFHEPSAISLENQEYFEGLYKYLSAENNVVEIQPVEEDVAVILQEKIINRSSDSDIDGMSNAQKKLMDILTGAVNSKASDIHFYLENDGKSRFHYRIYKRLQPPIRIGRELLENVLRSAWRINGSKVTEQFSENKSQDRTLELNIELKDKSVGGYKFRYQSSPLDSGLKVVMRVISTDDSKLGGMSFREFGYEDFQEHQIRMALSAHDGLLLVCGSTNSGKSTAISKMLIELKGIRPYWAIDSVEDPVENNLDGVAQHPVSLANVDNTNLNEKEAREEAFLRALMDLMRQDPDAINMGEIRDSTSAEICRDFVNTGHKLFSTIHAKRIMGSYGRLAKVGLSYDDLCRKEFLTAIIYQALIPTTCSKCSFESSNLADANKDKYLALSKFLPDLSEVRIHNPKGCSECRGGIKGLTVCAEILEPDAVFNQHIRDNDFAAAEKYWLKESELDNNDFEFKGRSLEDAIMFKVFKGIICPLVAEEFLKPLEYLDREYSTEVLFPKTKLKGVSNV